MELQTLKELAELDERPLQGYLNITKIVNELLTGKTGMQTNVKFTPKFILDERSHLEVKENKNTLGKWIGFSMQDSS